MELSLGSFAIRDPTGCTFCIIKYKFVNFEQDLIECVEDERINGLAFSGSVVCGGVCRLQFGGILDSPLDARERAGG